MQTNNLTTMPAIEKLLQRIKSAEKTNQKEVRITIAEARDLAIDLAMMTSKLNTAIAEVNENLKKISSQSQEIDVKFDGGDF